MRYRKLFRLLGYVRKKKKNTFVTEKGQMSTDYGYN